MEVYFEVYGRHPSRAKEETKVYENGVSALNKVAHKELYLANSIRWQLVWPQDKAIDASNKQHITFGIEELVGTLEMINKAIHMRDSLDDIDDKFTRNMLQDVSANFLHMVKDKVQANAEVKMPISYFTTAIEDSNQISASSGCYYR